MGYFHIVQQNQVPSSYIELFRVRSHSKSNRHKERHSHIYTIEHKTFIADVLYYYNKFRLNIPKDFQRFVLKEYANIRESPIYFNCSSWY